MQADTIPYRISPIQPKTVTPIQGFVTQFCNDAYRLKYILKKHWKLIMKHLDLYFQNPLYRNNPSLI